MSGRIRKLTSIDMKLVSPAAFVCLRLLPSVLAAIACASSAKAAIPSGYTGTPYQGTPQVIPGRVELANLDEGGLNVAFYADHRRENAVQEGYAPISGDDYRPGNLMLPNICKTNRSLEKPGEGSEDFWEDGKRYPSDDNMYVYYMGYAHTVDWVRVTVNVQQAGMYNVSSNWACANVDCGLSIWFNDGSGTADNAGKPLDGANKSGIVKLNGTNDYHKWRAYPNFAKVDLSAGPQVMTFHVEVGNHLQYGFLQFDPVGGPGSAGAGGTGSGGSGGLASGGAASGGNPSGGSAGASAAGGTSTGTAGTLASTAGSATIGAGTGGSNVVTPSAGSGGVPGAGGSSSVSTTQSNTDSGCSLAAAGTASRSSRFAGLGLLLATSLLLRRRKARAGAV